MKKVVSISLNGNSYQLEEAGYEQLRAYLERADSRLKDSPDRAEVMADLEQAIGEKCRAMLSPHKTVVSSGEVERIIVEMGPVESPDEKPAGAADDGAPKSSSSYPGYQPRKRLFKIREGQMFTGVCNGVPRTSTWMSPGAHRRRPADAVLGRWPVHRLHRAGVHHSLRRHRRGSCRRLGMPFNTEELISRAKKTLRSSVSSTAGAANGDASSATGTQQFRHMNEQLRAATAHAGPIVGQSARAIGGLFVVIAALIGALFAVALVLALFSLVTQQTIFGFSLPHGMPSWIGVLVLVGVYLAISTPLRMIRHGGHASSYHPGWGALHSLMWIGFVVLFFWAAYTFLPGVHELVDQLLWAANLTAATISNTIVWGTGLKPLETVTVETGPTPLTPSSGCTARRRRP
jgi:hypothetical protein